MLLLAVAISARYYSNHPELWPRRAPGIVQAPLVEPSTQSAASVVTRPSSIPAVPATPAQRPPPEVDVAEFGNERACFAPPTKQVETRPATQVHRWVDESGKVHFSDKAPVNAQTALYEPKGQSRRQFFELAIHYEGERSVPFLKDRMRAQVPRTYELLAPLIGDSRLRQVQLNVRLFKSHRQYQAYAAGFSARLATSGGFYSLKNNEAVTYQHPDDAVTLAVVRHESMHVIVAGLLGDVPPWLNEGLAEYFEELEMQGTQATVRPQAQWLQIAAQSIAHGYPRRLDYYLSLKARAWYNNQREVHYALGWALVYFLMDSDHGRAALANYLQELADHYCESIDPSAWIDRGYAGGVAELESRFKNWLIVADKAPHRY
jgi:hypothetical protein